MVSYMRSFFGKLQSGINSVKSLGNYKEFEVALKSSPLALQQAPFNDQ